MVGPGSGDKEGRGAWGREQAARGQGPVERVQVLIREEAEELRHQGLEMTRGVLPLLL